MRRYLDSTGAWTMSISILLPPGFRPVIKHGDHDQSSHGNWASGNFDEETEGEAAQNTYFDKYGMKVSNNGILGTNKEPVGISREEISAIDFYTGDGYLDINSFWRKGKNEWEPTSTSERVEYERVQELTQSLDALIEEAPDMFGDKNLFRIYSENVMSGIKEGDVVTDKGYLSTTRIDITEPEGLETLQNLQNIRDTSDIPAVILPSPSGKGKGLAVDYLKNSIQEFTTNVSTSNIEKEVLLPRGTSLKFKGYKTVSDQFGIRGGNDLKVAVFERVDK